MVVAQGAHAVLPAEQRLDLAAGCTAPLGWLPALRPRNFPWPQWLMSASARMLRAELPVHRKSAL